MAYEAERCPRCRQPYGAAHARENQFAYRAEVIRCHACAAMDRRREQFLRDGGEAAGLSTHLTRVPEEVDCG